MDKMLDFCEIARSELLMKRIDPRFKFTPFRRDLTTGDIVAYLDFKRPDGLTSTVSIVLDRKQMDVLSPKQIVDYIEMQVQLANDSLRDFIESDPLQEAHQ